MMSTNRHAPDRTARRAMASAAMVAFLATAGVVIGWRLFEFDRALFVYAQALVLSLALTTYRFVVWAHRPPTAMLYSRALQMSRCPQHLRQLCRHLAHRVVQYFAFNRFVFKRGLDRWSAHWPIMAGCVMATAIVVPLIFGWVWFETPHNDLDSYKVMLFGNHIRTIPVDGMEAFIAFHGLVWASFPVIVGCSVALFRRCKNRGEQVTQTFENDFLPLILLLGIATTGLLMTISYSFMEGRLHAPLASIHCCIVCGTLIWLPYGKLFHVPQRSLKFAHMIYEHEAPNSGRAQCQRCRSEFADQQQVDDLIGIQTKLGYRYELRSGDHYQLICPRCRRASLVIAQGRRWHQTPIAEPNVPVAG